MAAMEFDDFDALPDVLQNDRFGFLLEPSIASGLNAILSLRCTQIAVPEEMFDVMTVAIQGFEYCFRGRHTFDKTISGAFVETIDGAVTTALGNYVQQIGGTSSGNGVTKGQYASSGDLEVYDQSGNVALDYTLRNAWVSQLPQVGLEGSQAQAFSKSVNFTYDKFTYSTASGAIQEL